MIKPEQFPDPDSDRDAKEQKAIELYFDMQLSAGILRFGTGRSFWRMHNIEAVLQRYRDAGWTVEDTGSGFRFAKK